MNSFKNSFSVFLNSSLWRESNPHGPLLPGRLGVGGYTQAMNKFLFNYLNKFLSTCTIILTCVSVPVKFCLLNPNTTFFHSAYQDCSRSFQHSVKNMLHNPEDIVPQEGVEPSRLAAAAFEVAVSTIPPPGHCLVDIFLYVVVNRPLYGTRTRVTSLKGRRP